MNYRYVAEELAYLLNDAVASAIVYHARFAPTLAQVLRGSNASRSSCRWKRFGREAASVVR